MEGWRDVGVGVGPTVSRVEPICIARKPEITKIKFPS